MGIKITPALVLCLLCVQIGGADAGPWARIIRGVTRTYDPFQLEIVTEESGHLVATANYMDYDREPEVSHLPATIDGTRITDKRFWPDVTFEVSNDMKGDWRRIETHRPDGDRLKITLQSNSQNEWLHVDLEPFRAMIGKFKYGRVTLTNGERAIFEINNLSPPTRPPHAWQEMALNKIDPAQMPPFVVVAIFSPDGESVLASCGYRNDDAATTTTLNGTQTKDRKLFPYVTAQVAIDVNGVWTPVGTPATPGDHSKISIQPKAIVGDLNVDLDSFRPFIGKFRYGRLSLPNGRAAIFEMRSLLPPQEDQQ